MDQENQVREIIGFVFKGQRIVFSNIVKITKNTNNKLKTRQDNKIKHNKKEFLEKFNNAENVKITEIDKKLWHSIAKKYNMQYAVEYNQVEDKSYIYFNCSATKLESALKEYDAKLEAKKTKKTQKEKDNKIKNVIKKQEKSKPEKIPEKSSDKSR